MIGIIRTPEQFLDCYKNGQRVFTNLEFENGENFSSLDLSGATFRNCWLCVDFTKTNLTACKFIDCNIKTTDFTEANLRGASIINCAVESTVYKGAIIKDFIFENNSCYSSTLGQEDFIKFFT